MDHTIKKLPKSEIEITVTVPAESLEEHRKQAVEEISRDVNIKGFRKGKVPQHILEQYVDKKYVEAHAKELAIKRSYAEIVVKEKIQVIARPKVDILEEEPLKYKATVAVMPEVEIKDHKSVKVKKEDVKVDEKDIEAVIDDMKKYGTTYVDVDRKAKKKDRAEIDFEGFDKDGKTLEGTKSSNHPIILGDNTMIPGFEDEIIGMKKGETKDFNITFPKDYHKEDFQNKKVKFTVTLQRLEEPTMPEFDEALIEKMTGQKKSVADFKKEVKANIQAKKDQEAKQKREDKYVEELIKKMKVELPEALIEEEVHYIVEDMKNSIGARGMDFATFLEKTKTTEEDLIKKYRPEAERRIKIRLALQFVIKAEDIKVSDKELQEEFEKQKAFYPKEEQSKMEEEFKKGNLKVQLYNRLALHKLFEKVLA